MEHTTKNMQHLLTKIMKFVVVVVVVGGNTYINIHTVYQNWANYTKIGTFLVTCMKIFWYISVTDHRNKIRRHGVDFYSSSLGYTQVVGSCE